MNAKLSCLGIGREVTERLNSYGAKVYAISLETMEDLKMQFSNVEVLSMDLSNWCDVKVNLAKFLKGVELDGLVNNAGITICKPFEEFTEEDYDK